MRKSRKLFVEGLENRAMLAGNVSVSVDGDVLEIFGDGQSNGVSVQQLDTNRYFVTGFALNGANTTVNGGLNGRIVSGVRHIHADLGQGWDIFIMSNSDFRRNELAQQLSGGTAGPIQPSPEAANPNTTHPVTARLVGDMGLVMDEGNDGVGLGVRVGSRNANGDIVEGIVHIFGSSGDDRVIATYTQAFDDLLFDMGSGNDHVRADAVRVGDFLFASLGDGADSFFSNNAHGWHSQILGGSGNDGINLSNYRFEQEVFVDTGSGRDRVSANGLEGLSIGIVTGDGNDGVLVDGSTSHSGYTVDTGSGNDFVRLNATFVNDHLGVFLGDHDDTLRVSNTTTDDTTFSGGSGFDRYFNDGGNSLGSLDKSGFEQG